MQENKPIENLGNDKSTPNSGSQSLQLWDNDNSLESLLENTEITKNETISINISSLDDLIKLNLLNNYDFLIINPEKDKIKITFKKEEKIVDEKYINYPVYSSILILLKNITNLKGDINIVQEWTWTYKYDKSDIKLSIKTNPSILWEQILLKIQINGEITWKTQISQVISFITAISFVWLIIGWAFIIFVVMNAKTIEDVMFFKSLWISLNDINALIAKLTTIIFSLALFIEIIFFAIFWIKFLLTKKDQRKKRVIFWLLSIFLLLFTFITWSLWLVTVKKVNALPNWQDMSYWDIQLYDNTKLLIEKLTKSDALITNYWDLIWPMTIKFDLTYYAQKEKQKWLVIEKFLWDFWDWQTSEELTPIVIKEFNKKLTYNLKVTVIEKQIDWTTITKEIDSIPSISIKNIVQIIEEPTNGWWKKITLDASDLRNLWKIEWYLWDDFSKPQIVSEKFTPWKIIFSDTIIWLFIQKEWRTDNKLDKIFLIKWDETTWIKWEIYEYKTEDDRTYEFTVKNLSNSEDSWFIEEFTWIIWDFQKKIKANIWNEEESSKFRYTFLDYGKKEIKLIIKDSYWKTKEIVKNIEISKDLKFLSPIKIYNKTVKLNPRYDNNDYYILDLEVPTTLKFDTRLVKLDNPIYTLQDVKWDINWDWEYEKKWKTLDLPIYSEWKIIVNIEYIFSSIRNSSTTISIKESIIIDSIKKDAILDLEIILSDNWFVPTTVKFDASKSEVKWENIVKFIYDYGDWTPVEERDALNFWHKYIEAGNYDVKLTAVTETWKEYSMTKKLVLKPRPQIAKITTSLKDAPIYQWIDFSSSESQWQIIWYFWEFWDWSTSTDANPTHMYKKPWKYSVTLKLDFVNRNILTDVISIEITN